MFKNLYHKRNHMIVIYIPCSIETMPLAPVFGRIMITASPFRGDTTAPFAAFRSDTTNCSSPSNTSSTVVLTVKDLVASP